MRKLGMLVSVAMLLVSCGGGVDGPTVPVAESIAPHAAQTGAAAVVAAARPQEYTWVQVLEGPDPCSGQWHTITITWICREKIADGAAVMNCKREIVTNPTGYVGRGNITQVVNDQILNVRYSDILKNDAGDRMHVRSHGLLDLSTDTWRIFEFEAVCLSR